MAGDQKSSDVSSCLSMRRDTKMSKPLRSGPIVPPPKATITALNTKKDEVHRRKNRFNNMLRRRSREPTEREKDTISPMSDIDDEENIIPSSSHNDANWGTGDRAAQTERDLVTTGSSRHISREESENIRDWKEFDRTTAGEAKHRSAGAPQPAADYSSGVSSEYDEDNKSEPCSGGVEDEILHQNYRLRLRLRQLQEELADRDAMSRNQEAVQMEMQMNELRSRLHVSEKESQDRLQQLLLLKSSISSLTRVDWQATDIEIRESFSQLANRLREWIITNYRRSKLDLDSLPPRIVETLTSITPDYKRVESADRLSLYQAIFSSLLMRIFKEPIVVGFPVTGPLAAIRQSAEVLRSSGSAYHEWRRTTIRALEASQAKCTLIDFKDQLLRELAAEIEYLLFTVTSTKLAASGQTSLIDILNTASSLQRTLALQKARYDAVFFHAHDGTSIDFDGRRMECSNDLDSIMNDDGDALTEGKVFFCVFPCIEKFGDEWGEHLESSNVLLKGIVCCTSR